MEKPQYTIFIQTSDDYGERIIDVLKTREFVYSPYLGHMYCPARLIYDYDDYVYDASEIDICGKSVSSVVLDESETYKSFKMDYDIISEDNEDSRIIIERHLHHFMNNGKLDTRVLKHLIPIQNTKMEITSFNEKPQLSKFIQIKKTNENICIY